jgi:hypothetical protein
VEGNSATWRVITVRSFRYPFDGQRAARGTDQRFLVPIRRDQNQRFWRAVLLDAPTTHRSALLVGFGGTNLATPPQNNLGSVLRPRKGLHLRSL